MIKLMIDRLMVRGLSLIGIAAASLLALWGWGYAQQSKGVEKERARQIERGRQLNARAKSARDRARHNPRRMLDAYVRD